MGRFVKNTALHSASYAIRVPVGDDTVAPFFPVEGQIRYNKAISNVEVYYNGSWKGVGLIGRVAIEKDTFTGNGIQTRFPMYQSYLPGQEADILVFVGNVFQNPGVAYTISGYDIEFTSAPNDGLPVVVLHNFNSTNVR